MLVSGSVDPRSFTWFTMGSPEHDGFKIRNLDDFQGAFGQNFRRKNFYAPKIIKHSPNPFREDVEYQPLMVSML